MKKLGFTLIELLISIAIIGILASLIIANMQGIRERARDARRKSDLASLKTSLRLYYNDNKAFPASNSGDIVGCGTPPIVCTWGSSSFASNGTTYMTSLPSDPGSSASNPKNYAYYAEGTGNAYVLIAQLENASDSEISASQARCSTAYSLYPAGLHDTAVDYLVCE